MARTKWISIRMSDEEYEKAMNDKRKNHEIFMTGLNRENIKDRTEIIKNIKIIGNNINQIARILNSDKSINDKNTKPILKYLKIVNDTMMKYDN